MTEIPTFEIIRSRRSSIALQINTYGKVVVKAPPLVPKFIITRYIRDNMGWIEKRLKLVSDHGLNNSHHMENGDEYLYLGDIYRIQKGKYKEITFADGKFLLPDFLLFRAEKELKHWYILQAKKLITERVEYYSQVMKKTYKSISYSDTISQWGSCSRDNRLHFNWRLIMAPLLVIDYVIVHELVHTTEKNHQARFWQEVARYKPAYKQYIKWLKVHSHSIHSL